MAEEWNYFAADQAYSDVLKARLADGVEMDSAKAMAGYLHKHCSGDLDVVDFGSGPGHYYPVLRRHYGGGRLRYLGVDIDESNIRFGAKHFERDADCRFSVGSVLEPAAATPPTANCVVSANTLPHVPTIVPLLRMVASTATISRFVFRMLIGRECVQIKKHLRENEFDAMFERDFQLNNIYSLAFIKHHLGGAWDVVDEPDVFDVARLEAHVITPHEGDEFYQNRVSRAVGSLVFKGEIYMPWRFVIGRRTTTSTTTATTSATATAGARAAST